MKKLLFIAALFLAAPVMAQGIEFRDITPEEAIAAAKAEGKYLFVDVYTDWCGPCKMMDAQIYTLKEVGDHFNPKYVSIKLNAEMGTVGPAFAKKYGVTAYPTYLIIDGNGELVHMFAGGTLSLAFIDKVEEAFDPDLSFGAVKKRYDAGERDKQLVARYIQGAEKASLAGAQALSKEFFDSLTDAEKVSRECLFFFDAQRLGTERSNFLVANLDGFRKAAGDKAVDEVMARKYLMFYAYLLHGYEKATPESLAKVDADWAALGINNNELIDVLREASGAKVSSGSSEAVFNHTVAAVRTLTPEDANTMIYAVTIGLKDKFTDEQKQILLTLVTSDYIKGQITKALS